MFQDGALKLLGRLSLLSDDILWSAYGLPNPFCSSDHLCLLASFGLEHSDFWSCARSLGLSKERVWMGKSCRLSLQQLKTTEIFITSTFIPPSLFLRSPCFSLPCSFLWENNHRVYPTMLQFLSELHCQFMPSSNLAASSGCIIWLFCYPLFGSCALVIMT